MSTSESSVKLVTSEDKAESVSESANGVAGSAVSEPLSRAASVRIPEEEAEATSVPGGDATPPSGTTASEDTTTLLKPRAAELDTTMKSQVKTIVTTAPESIKISTSSVSAVPKIIVTAMPGRSSTPVLVGTRVVPVSSSAPSVSGPASGPTSVVTVPQPTLVSLTALPAKAPRVPTLTSAPGRGAVFGLPRTTAQQQGLAVSHAAQTTAVQLPTNFQIPQGMVLIRSDSGQLMLVSQQALAQAQAQGIVPKPATASVGRPVSAQGSASAPPIIRVSPPPTCTTGTNALKASSATGLIGLKPSSAGKSTTQAPVGSIIRGNSTNSGTTGNCASVVKPVGRPAPPPVVTQMIRSISNTPRHLSPNVPIKSTATKTTTPITAETLENVKKCKSFLVTLMKLASSGIRSADMALNVRGLVKDLLDGKLEAEEFTDKLYMELKSSPQPYLVPFLQKSLPAVRQLTPNSQLFIQQCDQPKPLASSPALASASSNMLKLTSQSTAVTQSLRPPQPTKPAQLLMQQPKSMVVKPSAATVSRLSLPVQNQSQLKHLIIQTHAHPTGVIVRQSSQVSKPHTSQPLHSTHSQGFKDAATGSFREEDDINDVASMAGVNLIEENARILAAGSELVGSVIRSCQDEPFVPALVLKERVLRLGRPFGVSEVALDVLSLLSQAMQERLRGLLENLTVIAQHRNVSYRDDWRYRQTSDARAQLKFLEQLEKLEKQRKEEEERETLLRIAKSRSSSADPEQIQLKQRAKEMQQLELAQIEHRDANLAALAALGPRKRKPLETHRPRASQPGVGLQCAPQRAQTRVTLRDLILCMEQDPALQRSLMLYGALLR